MELKRAVLAQRLRDDACGQLPERVEVALQLHAYTDSAFTLAAQEAHNGVVVYGIGRDLRAIDRAGCAAVVDEADGRQSLWRKLYGNPAPLCRCERQTDDPRNAVAAVNCPCGNRTAVF